MLSAPALRTYRGSLEFMIFLKWEDDRVQMVSMHMYNFAEELYLEKQRTDFVHS